jgi:hypothetical protein
MTKVEFAGVLSEVNGAFPYINRMVEHVRLHITFKKLDVPAVGGM